jgi:hypothetical protein
MTTKAKYYRYTLKAPARALYSNLAEASTVKGQEAAKSKYSVMLGIENEDDAKALFALAKQGAEEAGFVEPGKAFSPSDFQLCVSSGAKAAEKVLAKAAIDARGKSEEEAFKIKESAEARAELLKPFKAVLTANSRVAFHDRFTDRYMSDLDVKERERADKFGFKLAVIENGKVIALDTAHLFATYKDKFYRGAYVGGSFNLSPWARKKAEDKDGVTAYIEGAVFVKDGERITGGAPSVQDSFAHYTGMATDYSPSQAAVSADEF